MTLVFTNGCFRYPHEGHRHCLAEARTLGDVLIVAVNSDESLRRVRAGQFALPFPGRSRRIAEWGIADRIIEMHDDDPCRLIRELKPDVLFKGGSTDEIVGADIVLGYGGKVVRGSLLPGYSSTKVIAEWQGLQTL